MESSRINHVSSTEIDMFCCPPGEMKAPADGRSGVRSPGRMKGYDCIDKITFIILLHVLTIGYFAMCVRGRNSRQGELIGFTR